MPWRQTQTFAEKDLPLQNVDLCPRYPGCCVWRKKKIGFHLWSRLDDLYLRRWETCVICGNSFFPFLIVIGSEVREVHGGRQRRRPMWCPRSWEPKLFSVRITCFRYTFLCFSLLPLRLFCYVCFNLMSFRVASGWDHSRESCSQPYLLQVDFVVKMAMATAPQELKVKTLQGEMINVTVAPANTVKELRTMLLESKGCEDPIERQLLKVEVLTCGLLVDDDQTVESAGLLCPESDVTVIYTRSEVEAATRQSIHERGTKGVIVPSHVTEIAPEAFEYDEMILTVTLPESVTSIGANAFDGCLSLARIVLPDSLTIIEPSAFVDCVSLESVMIPDSVSVVGAGAFADCKALKHITLPQSLATISRHIFEGCDSLTSITIPASVKVIEKFAFFHCRSLERVVMSWGVEQIGESAFHFCEALVHIHIPASVTIIGKLAFAGCRSLSEISIPGSVQTLGDYAFGDCYSLERLLVDEGVLVIGHGAFANCRSLTNIWISESLRCNVEGAFEPHVLQHITLFRDSIRGLVQRPFRIRNYATRTRFTQWDLSPTALDESVQDDACGTKSMRVVKWSRLASTRVQQVP